MGRCWRQEPLPDVSDHSCLDRERGKKQLLLGGADLVLPCRCAAAERGEKGRADFVSRASKERRAGQARRRLLLAQAKAGNDPRLRLKRVVQVLDGLLPELPGVEPISRLLARGLFGQHRDELQSASGGRASRQLSVCTS